MNMVLLNGLTKTETSIYKAFAILLILFHNFFHVVRPKPGENEFDFKEERIEYFVDYITSIPLETINLLFSYFGHYGVQMFIFLSAYGLTKKYSDSWPGYFIFIKDRVYKIYPVIFLLVITIWLFRGIYKGDLYTFQYLYELFLKLTMISNFIPGHALSIVGPWWFLSLIFQFYFIFPFLLKLYKNYGEVALLYVSLFSLLFVYSASFILEYNFYYLFIPHIPEFSLGIYLAHRNHTSISKYIFVIIMLFFILSNYYNEFWYLSGISALILMLYTFKLTLSLIKSYNILFITFTFIGAISMELFLVHGFLRQPFMGWASHMDNWFSTLVFATMFFLISVVVAYVLNRGIKLSYTYYANKLK